MTVSKAAASVAWPTERSQLSGAKRRARLCVLREQMSATSSYNKLVIRSSSDLAQTCKANPDVMPRNL